MGRILIAEDEQPIAQLVRLTLEQARYRCDIAPDGPAAAEKIGREDYDLVLLDVMLPGMDGFELMEYLQPAGTPVIFLTARAGLADRVRGLRLGADDYIVKPFEPMELAARVEAVLRRAGRLGTVGVFGLEVDPAGRTVKREGAAIPLTPREFDLFLLLVRNRGLALYRDVIYERVWGEDLSDEGTRTLDLHIQRLRKKLGLQKQIRTVYKIGYMLEAE